MGLPVWRDPEETRSSSSSSVAVSRVKNDSTAPSRSPIRRLRASRPTSFHRLGQPPPVPEAPRHRIPSSERHFDLAYYLGDDNSSSQSDAGRRRSRPSSFLPPPLERDRPQSRSGVSSSLPTPPLETSEPTASSRIVLLRPSQVPPHPLSFAHRPVSPDDGLGDRNRSPSPTADSWHLANELAEDSSSTIYGPDTSGRTNHDRRAVEALLYDFAMQTAEGRAQISLIRRMSPEDTLWIRHHSSVSQENEDDDNNEEDEAPPRRPSQFDSDIRERSRQVAASTMRYSGNTRRARTADDTPPLSRSNSPGGSRLFSNAAARRTETFLARSLREAEEQVRNER
ncbi:unnamed protein product [Aureobasidium pullulans]|nr:unnamed protein product [Aureobasidium pullulans]